VSTGTPFYLGWGLVMSEEQSKRLDDAIDPAKRETLRKLAQAAWAIPVVATFAVGGLSMSSKWAFAQNSTVRS
jgi:hypothetical protein